MATSDRKSGARTAVRRSDITKEHRQPAPRDGQRLLGTHVAKDNSTRPLDPITVSVAEASRITGESQWTVKDKLRNGIYQARKSGRRTLVIYASIVAAIEALPIATFAAPADKQKNKAA